MKGDGRKRGRNVGCSPVMHSVYRKPGRFLLTSVFMVHLQTIRQEEPEHTQMVRGARDLEEY